MLLDSNRPRVSSSLALVSLFRFNSLFSIAYHSVGAEVSCISAEGHSSISLLSFVRPDNHHQRTHTHFSRLPTTHANAGSARDSRQLRHGYVLVATVLPCFHAAAIQPTILADPPWTTSQRLPAYRYPLGRACPITYMHPR